MARKPTFQNDQEYIEKVQNDQEYIKFYLVSPNLLQQLGQIFMGHKLNTPTNFPDSS